MFLKDYFGVLKRVDLRRRLVGVFLVFRREWMVFWIGVMEIDRSDEFVTYLGDKILVSI